MHIINICFIICHFCDLSILVLSIMGLTFVLLVETSDTLYGLEIIPVCDIITGLKIFTESDISPNVAFHKAYTTDVAYLQGTLTPLDTCSRPIWNLHMFYLLRPFPNLSLFSWTMLFKHSSVLYRFCHWQL